MCLMKINFNLILFRCRRVESENQISQFALMSDVLILDKWIQFKLECFFCWNFLFLKIFFFKFTKYLFSLYLLNVSSSTNIIRHLWSSTFSPCHRHSFMQQKKKSSTFSNSISYKNRYTNIDDKTAWSSRNFYLSLS